MKRPAVSTGPSELRFGSFTWKLTLRLAALVIVTSAVVLAAGGALLSRQWRRNIDALHETEFRELDQIVAEVAPLTPKALEHRIQGEDGEWQWMRARGRAVARDEKGRITRIAGTARNMGIEVVE